MREENKGITLLALVITIIILLILAAITLNLTIGQNGIFRKAQYAKEQYENAQEKEQKELNKLYSEMLIATNDSSQITVNMEDLKGIIQEQVREETKELKTQVEELKSQLETTNQKIPYIDTSKFLAAISVESKTTTASSKELIVPEDCVARVTSSTYGHGRTFLEIDGISYTISVNNDAYFLATNTMFIPLSKGTRVKIIADLDIDGVTGLANIGLSCYGLK